jgi:ATP-dependent 26S proteasome regulatory subunit
MVPQIKSAFVMKTLLDSRVPIDQRKALLGNLSLDSSDASKDMIAQLLSRAGKADAEAAAAESADEMSELKRAMEEGPLRVATFVRRVDDADLEPRKACGGVPDTRSKNGRRAARAEILLDSGSTVYVRILDNELTSTLRTGDNVLIDARGKVLLRAGMPGPAAGEEARFQRRIDTTTVEVLVRDHERHVYLAAAPLVEKLDAGKVAPHDWLLVCTRRQLAIDAVPAADGLGHFRYLERRTMPDVIVSRDIGDPSPFIADQEQHIRMEMTKPALSRRYARTRSRFSLLSGVSGSGKTLSIEGLWCLMYQVMSELTRAPVRELPPRVLRLRTATLLSKWLGESEKQLDRFFDEVEALAEQKFVAPDGKEHELPVLVICEEADAFGRRRGSDGIHDRIQTTLLERLDTTSQRLKHQLVLFVFTTNVPELVDPAFLRRAGGKHYRFGRLNQRACHAVLDKITSGIPFMPRGDEDQVAARQRVKAELLTWLFSPNGQDQGQVELTYVGATEPVLKYRRDFLTGALLARVVQDSADGACLEEFRSRTPGGIRTCQLMAALDDQVRAIVDQLHPSNVDQYLTLPDGVRVASIRRVPQPRWLPSDLER